MVRIGGCCRPWSGAAGTLPCRRSWVRAPSSALSSPPPPVPGNLGRVRLRTRSGASTASIGGEMRGKNGLGQCFACFFEKDALSAAVRLVGFAGAVADGRKPDGPKLTQGG